MHRTTWDSNLKGPLMRKLLHGSMGLFLVAFLPQIVLAQTIRSASGVNAAAIQASVDAFRNDLGINNGGGPCVGACVPGKGRREINWDGVPDNLASGSGTPFSGDFFNQATGSPAGRVRGTRFTTSGTFEVSADLDSNNDGTPGPIPMVFGNRHPDNANDFAAFSPERIFGIIGSNEMDVFFSVPGEPTQPALVLGFGAVFTDVEVEGSTRLDFYDVNNNLLHSGTVPRFETQGNDSGESFSFLGVSFASPSIARVHITNGGFDLDLQQFGADDGVAMDDFIYAEPVAVPEPAPMGLSLVLLGIWMVAPNRSAARR
jgi:hypothetical protein